MAQDHGLSSPNVSCYRDTKENSGLFLDGGSLGQSPCSVSAGARRRTGTNGHSQQDKKLADPGSTAVPVPGGAYLNRNSKHVVAPCGKAGKLYQSVLSAWTLVFNVDREFKVQTG